MADHKRQESMRQVVEFICKEPDCEFYDEPAQQGVCHSADPDVADIDKLHSAGEQFAKELREIRTEHYKTPEEYIPWLEAMYECVMLNWTFCLDECIRLRRELALLKKG